jgi:uridine kinase
LSGLLRFFIHRHELLLPLGPGGTGRYRTKTFDHLEDADVRSSLVEAAPNAILLFDGIFVLTPELRSCWDFTIFVKAGFEVTLARALTRDAKLFGSEQEVVRRYQARYIPGQKIYLSECNPQSSADIVIDNDNPESPSLIRER